MWKFQGMSGLLLLAVVLAAGLVVPVAEADELELQDGSRLLGRVVRVKDGVVEFETAYAGTLNIKWSSLVNLKVDEPVDVFLDSKELVPVTGMHVEDGSIQLDGVNVSGRTVSEGQFVSVNPEPWERGIGYKVSGHANAGVELQDGNTNQNKLVLNGDAKFRRLHDRTTFAGQYQRDESEGVLTARNWQLRSKYDYFVTDKRYYGASLNFENDRFADLRLRTTVGPHIGYQFYESRQMNLSVDGSVLYVSNDYYVANTDEYAALGWNADFDRLLVGDLLQFYHRHHGLLEAGEWENLVVNSWTGLRFPLYAGLVAGTEVQVDYDGAAPSGVDKIDTIWRVNLGYQW